ncbi:DUF962 domain-containing protein [Pseudomonas yamanorum]|uniref:DUF962 domain-containing protein n=1 Tax=Pseudomonas yamanorum TaxID=515393 RepID=UPI001C470590|nr:DUF962 domain-containing protein [Pseudomonas yamanorum]MBV6659764.1 DUF962 domain-containing protein [Pseudomonas yamanorum]
MKRALNHSDSRDFYAFYLSEHSNRTSRRLHFMGSTIAISLVGATLFTGNGWLCALALIQAYGFAWVGHFFYEKNRPATFKHPIKSFISDWRMWWDTLTGKIPF